MAQKFTELQHQHIEFIAKQHMFFVGTAGAEGLINVSPKGLDSLRILEPNRVAWLNMTGSGNESAAHVIENSRMTIMFCSFDQQPLILRLYGEAEVVYPRHESWDDLTGKFPRNSGARQIFDLKINLVQTSCGYAVPFYDYKGERPTLTNWAEKIGPTGVEEYWQKNNTRSLDGKPTGIFEES